jgi:predicted dehydrogenase
MARRGLAIVGLGMAVTPHAKSLLDLQDRIVVRAAVSRSEARRAAFADVFPFPVTGDLEAVIADPEIEAVLLLTPPDARLELVRKLAGAGKHILMEKPVERTTAAATEIVETCERAGVRLGIVLQHRFRQGAARLAALAGDGALGELAAVQFLLPWWRPQAYYDVPGRGTRARDGGGVLLTQAIHALDVMLSVTGPVQSVAALGGTTRLHRMETEDFVGAGLLYQNGAIGGLIATTAAYPGATEQLIVTGTAGSATLSGGELRVSWLDGRNEEVGEPTATGGGADPMAFPHDWHRALISDFLDALDQDREPRVNGRSVLAVHRLIDALLQSSTQGCAVQLG